MERASTKDITTEGPSVREFEWKGRTGPFTLQLVGDVFIPTHTSMEVAEAFEFQPGETVIDVGSGCGVLSFVALRLGAEFAYGTDLNPWSEPSAKRNAEAIGLTDRTDFRTGSLFEPLGDLRAEVIIGDVAGVPDELARATGWYPGGFSGGPTGAEVPTAMLKAAPDHLKPGGRLYLPTGTFQTGERVLKVARQTFGEDRMRKIRERSFPLPGNVANDESVRRLIDDGVFSVTVRGSRLLWTLVIWEVTAPD